MSDFDWTAVQRALHMEGYDAGPIDGIKGRLTIAALKAFQEDNGLAVDGIAGPATMAALFGFDEPMWERHPWYDEAERFLGLSEDQRKGKSNPEVVRLGEIMDLDYRTDDTPWCGLFVGHVIAATLPEEPLPEKPLWSRAWLEFGTEVSPQKGAVLVFWRGSPDGWTGHCGFYAGEDAEAYHVLGGNQNDEVSIVRIEKKRFLGARWPMTGPRPPGITEERSGDGPVSKDEA